MKACQILQLMFCSREYQPTTRLSQQNEKHTQIILEENGLEALHLFRDWERLQLRASNYKNCRIFTLRCIHKELVPVSRKLKTTLRTDKARKIILKCRKKSTSGWSQSYKQHPRQHWQTNRVM